MLHGLDGGQVMNRALDELLGFVVIGSMALAWSWILFHGV